MAFRMFLLVSLFTLVTTSVSITLAEEATAPILDVASLNRSSFPKGFIFGTASASYQYEGAAKEGGRGESIWDTFTHKYPDKIQDRSNGDVANDEYHRYKEDVGIMKKDFGDYAELCYKEFGDRVKYWITLNEPWSYSNGGYATGQFAPGRCSDWMNQNCTGGDSGIEPYLASHYQLLAHAEAVQIYRKKYQESQKGVIGITLLSHWFVPFSNNESDKKAAKRAIDFMFGWLLQNGYIFTQEELETYCFTLRKSTTTL
ncbi:unnamed protein product [Lupinus luteus]|uniref:Beta-glucosidase n=1 Tax=Lupinus luteus TaxID=3873 RepID=A0AAV1WZI7_LUPLU